ncbi:hypothetical protein IF2G_08771 [Cordyceps javanica]|nr:hypothetical protein IF2G_08771 [Cordyceps javanica]
MRRKCGSIDPNSLPNYKDYKDKTVLFHLVIARGQAYISVHLSPVSTVPHAGIVRGRNRLRTRIPLNR